MKGKLLVFFLLALIALVVVGLIGRSTVASAVESVRNASAPNEKMRLLDEIFQNLLDAESSVRTYTITGNEDMLNAFKQSASTIDTQLANIGSLTDDSRQLIILKEIEALIQQKFTNFSDLIQLREAGRDSTAMERVLADIEELKARDSSENSGAVFQQLFGQKKETLISDSLFDESTQEDLSSTEVGRAISRINRQIQLENEQRLNRELQLTQTDYKLTERFRGLTAQFEKIDKEISATQTERVTEASQQANTYITWITVATLVAFGILLFIIFTDLSRSQKNREELRLAKEHAEFLARAKEEFLSNMSHEIRTPLNAVIGFSDQLVQKSLPPEEEISVQKIRNSGKHLLALVNDILDTAKLEAGKIHLETVGFSPRNELADVLDLFRSQADEKGLQLQSRVAEAVPRVLIGDPMRFRQILINLISNGLKFTGQGHISTMLEGTANEEMFSLTISVKDTGIGIPQEKLENIFDDFTQADSSTTRKYGGTGLGLSIVRKITELHGGKTDVSSEPGKGTTFTVQIKYKIGEPEDIADLPSVEGPPPDFSGLRILVVDDQSFNLEIAGNVMQPTGATLATADSGTEALNLLNSQPYDIVLMDIQMPDISGTDVCAEIRKGTGPNRDVRFLALTAGVSESEKELIMDAGMNDILLKPLDRPTLYRAIQDHIPSQVAIQLDELQSLANGDEQFVSRMITLFRENIQADLEEFDRAATTGDLNKLKQLAHKMIPPCRHLGLEDLVKSLRNLQEATLDDNKLWEPMYKNARQLILQAIDAADSISRQTTPG